MDDVENKGVPEAIALAERWREAGKVLAARSPEAFEEFQLMFDAWLAMVQQEEARVIDSVYQAC